MNTSVLAAFDPWIGASYPTTGFGGVRILILGESQYDTDETLPRPGIRDTEKDTTKRIVEDLAVNASKGYRPAAVFTKTAKLFLGYGRPLSDQERAAFWHEVAFYNYIQWWLHDKRVRPTREMWRAAQAPFLQVLHEHAPQFLLVLGRDLQRELPPIPEHIVTLAVPHPSGSYGWTYEPWATQIGHAVNALRIRSQ